MNTDTSVSDRKETEYLIVFQHISKTYYKNDSLLKAVDDVSFTMKSGSCLGLAGESGSGKSTVAGILTGQIEPDSGAVIFDGKSIVGSRKKRGKPWPVGMQMVFQSPQASFDPRRRLGFSVGEGLRNTGMAGKEVRGQIKKLFEMVDLDPELAEHYPHEVSGGQCQRAAIARALAMRPKLLICDEATSALDALVQRQITELLKNLQKKLGLSIFFICHDLALIQDMCDCLLLMDNGKIVESQQTF